MNNFEHQYADVIFHSKLVFSTNKSLGKQDFKIILQNLIDNSVKYQSNQIDIHLKFEDKITIVVRDNGLGIPKNEQKFIFDKYYRISRPENMHASGLGIGLYMVKQIVEKYQGKICVSNNPSRGVTFEIVLPNEN